MYRIVKIIRDSLYESIEGNGGNTNRRKEKKRSVTRTPMISIVIETKVHCIHLSRRLYFRLELLSTMKKNFTVVRPICELRARSRSSCIAFNKLNGIVRRHPTGNPFAAKFNYDYGMVF